MRNEAAKSTEFQESVKQVSNKVEEIKSTEAVKATSKVLEKAKEKASEGNKIISDQAKAVKDSVGNLVTKMGVGGRKKRRRYVPTEKKESKGVLDDVSEKLEDFDEGASVYGGIRSKTQRERRKKEKIFLHEKIKESQPKIEENPE